MTSAAEKRKIGLHLSAAGGLLKIPPRAAALGCSAAQLFTQAPSQWKRRPVTDEEARLFAPAMAGAGVREYVVHAIYLLNLASSDDALRERSIAHLAEELGAAAALGASAVVVHLGSAGAGQPRLAGIERLAESLCEARRRCSTTVPLALENSAGGGATLGRNLEELAEIVARAREAEPLRYCIDTAHAFGSGLAVHTVEGLEEMLRTPGLRERISLIHLNDSHVAFASNRDRHWHLGQGEIGGAALMRIVNHPALRHLPLVMESPGTEHDDRANMARLLRLIPPQERPPRAPRPFRSPK